MDQFITADQVEAKGRKDWEKCKNSWEPIESMPEILGKYGKTQKLNEELKLDNHEIKAMDLMEKQWIKKTFKELKENINEHEIRLVEKNCQTKAAQAQLYSLKARKQLDDLNDELEELRKLSEEWKQIQFAELEKMTKSKTAKTIKTRSKLKESYHQKQASATNITVKTPVVIRKTNDKQRPVTPSPNIIVTRSKSRSKR